MRFVNYYKSTTSILLLCLLGIILGYYYGDGAILLKPIGDLFIALIKMMLIPIVLFAIIQSMSSLQNHSSAFKIGSFALLYFFLSGFISALFGIMLANFMEPGVGLSSLPKDLFASSEEVQNMAKNTSISLSKFLFNIIPNNPFDSIAKSSLLQIVFFGIFFGIALSYVKNDKKQIVVDGVVVINDTLMWMIDKIMYLAPLAIFSLMSYLVANIGLDLVFLLAKLFVVIILACFIWIYVILGLCVVLFSKVSYLDYVKTTAPLSMFAFSTSSSMVSLPKNMETCDKLGVSKETSRFILPIAANMNMNGSAFYYTIVTIFFAQIFNVDLSIETIFLMAFIASFGAMATPGVPGASLTIIMVMVVANVPLIAIPIFFAIDRILDMFITMVNVLGDTVCSLIADKVIVKK